MRSGWWQTAHLRLGGGWFGRCHGNPGISARAVEICWSIGGSSIWVVRGKIRAVAGGGMDGIVLCITSGGLRRLAGFFAEKGAGAFRFVRRRLLWLRKAYRSQLPNRP
jgi:hypothetical protein